MHADSETTHPVKFLPELTCKSEMSLNCLEKVKIIKDLQMWEREKKKSQDSREDGDMVLDQNLSRGRLFGNWKLLEAFVEMGIE